MSERARDAVAKQLRRMIITGELEPGSPLSEAYIMDMLGCSRTPLREALQDLRNDYLLTLPPRRGVLIPELGIIDFQQAHEAALSIDMTCIDLAAVRMTTERLAEMSATVEQQVRARDTARFYDLAELDSQFHSLIAAASGNKYLADCGRRLRAVLARFVYRAYATVGSADRALREHREIVEALENSDPDLARRKLKEHTVDGRQRILNVLGLGDRDQPL